MDQLAEVLSKHLGPKGWIASDEASGHVRDWLNQYGERPLGVARPATTEEVAMVVSACNMAGVPVVPQGGNTSLCGAAVAGQPGAVTLALSRMSSFGTPDLDTGTVEVEAGVVLEDLHSALAPIGQIFPMHLGAEGSAQIGGLIGTNAGGSHAMRYGMMQDLVVGLEVVLPDGSVWNGMRVVQKDNAGYQLRRLFCGAEGTLGIVTRAVLKLYPAPKARATALLALPSVEALVSFGTYLRAEAGDVLSGLEFFSDVGLDLALRKVTGLDFPLETRSPWYLLVELTAGSTFVPIEEMLEAALTHGMEEGLVADGTIAMSEAQRSALWRLREEQPEGQRLEGAQLKHDISVPPGKLAQFVAQGAAVVEEILPNTRTNPFGHLGDGNVHYNLSPPEGKTGFEDLASEFARRLGALAQDMGGSFAAEHGLGRSNIALADLLREPVERRLMAKLKHAIDPGNLMNPGVIVSGSQL